MAQETILQGDRGKDRHGRPGKCGGEIRRAGSVAEAHRARETARAQGAFIDGRPTMSRGRAGQAVVKAGKKT